MMIAFASAAVFSMPAFAAGTDTATAAKQKKAADESKIICRKYPVTGSLTQTKRICHTRADWKLLAEQARQDTETMQTEKNGIKNN